MFSKKVQRKPPNEDEQQRADCTVVSKDCNYSDSINTNELSISASNHKHYDTSTSISVPNHSQSISYIVVYYQRSSSSSVVSNNNNNHNNKNLGRRRNGSSLHKKTFDGILTISTPPSSMVTLTCTDDNPTSSSSSTSDDDGNQSDDDNDTMNSDDNHDDNPSHYSATKHKNKRQNQYRRYTKQQKKYKIMRKKQRISSGTNTNTTTTITASVYSGKNVALSQRIMKPETSFQLDEIIQLTPSSWICQIMSSPSYSDSISGNPHENNHYKDSTNVPTQQTSTTRSDINHAALPQKFLKESTDQNTNKVILKRNVSTKSRLIRLVNTSHPSSSRIGANNTTTLNTESNPSIKILQPDHKDQSCNDKTYPDNIVNDENNSIPESSKIIQNPLMKQRLISKTTKPYNKTTITIPKSQMIPLHETKKYSTQNINPNSNESSNSILYKNTIKNTLLQSSSSSCNTTTNLPPSEKSATTPTTTTSDVIQLLPKSIQNILRPHQVTGIEFLWNCLVGHSAKQQQSLQRICWMKQNGDGNRNNNGVTMNNYKGGAILADEMGLGKTLITISMIFALYRRNRQNRYIIVCPSSLVNNWSKEFDKWIGPASQPKRIIISKGGEIGRENIKSFVQIKPNLSEILILSYELYRLNSCILSQAKNIGTLIVDEGHRLKNSAGSLTISALESLNCDSRLLITGTPIQNNLAEFYTLANFVCPGILGDLNTFRQEFEKPLANSNNKYATFQQVQEGNHRSKELDQITSSFMIRRLQNDILKSILPPRNEYLLFCRPSQNQCDFYKRLTSGISISVESTSGFSNMSFDSLSILTKLRQLCCHPNLIEETNRNNACRMKQVSQSGKLVVLKDLLSSIKQSSNAKVVIVSNYTSVLSIIEDMILKDWSFLRLDGSTDQSERQRIVDSFNRLSQDHSFVLLLSSKAGGCGLNLIGANRLIMFDPDYNPAIDMQAMARIYRQGQQKPCFIYRLFLSGTVEEVILQRQMQKSNLAKLAVDSKGISSGGKKKRQSMTQFTPEELRDCFVLKEGIDCDTKNKMGEKWLPNYSVFSFEKCNIDDIPLQTTAKKNTHILSYIHSINDCTNERPETRMLDYDFEVIEKEDISDESDNSCTYSNHSSSSDEAEWVE